MGLIFAAALLTQYPPSSADMMRADLIFARAVEESVMTFPGATPDPAYAGLLGLLGAESYLGRVDATTRLESAMRRDPGAMRWLWWGRKHEDPEIASRCNGLIRRLAVCPTCRGTGRSKQSWAYHCWDCEIPIWPFSPWD